MRKQYYDNVDNLRRTAILNAGADPAPYELFVSRFFDSSDIVQVKYEMLRRVAIDGVSVRDATAAFGYSRQAFYDAKANFEQSGVAGLLSGRHVTSKSRTLAKEVPDLGRFRDEPSGFDETRPTTSPHPPFERLRRF